MCVTKPHTCNFADLYYTRALVPMHLRCSGSPESPITVFLDLKRHWMQNFACGDGTANSIKEGFTHVCSDPMQQFSAV